MNNISLKRLALEFAHHLQQLVDDVIYVLGRAKRGEYNNITEHTKDYELEIKKRTKVVIYIYSWATTVSSTQIEANKWPPSHIAAHFLFSLSYIFGALYICVLEEPGSAFI